MCLAIIVHGEHPDWPIFVAANRDEDYRRPSLAPSVSYAEGVAVLAPRDVRAGGTWIGINDQQIFAVITNRSDLDGTPPVDARSRGLLVQEVLRAPDLAAARATVTASAGLPSAPFNLIFGDPASLWLAARDLAGTRVTPLSSGLHVVANSGEADDDSVEEVERARELWRSRLPGDVELWDPWEAAAEILTRPPLLKRHASRGTVSATLLGVSAGHAIRMLHAEGPPDRTPFVEVAFSMGVPS